jgi:flagellin-like hook-associated protein FlgL
MSGIVLSASVRQNLLSLQSTAALLATTQNDLATGNAVNSALDNPTSYFTAQSLNNRASDISSLLDSIGNGVQVLQAANTGITSLQSLVSNAQSIANQVLQAPTGYSTKSSFTAAAVTGATADNLLGTSAAGTNGAVTGTTALSTVNLTGTAATNAVATGTSALSTIDLTGNQTAATNASATATTAIADTGAGIDATGGLTFDVNGQTVTLAAGGGSGTSGTWLASDIASAINSQVGTSAGVSATDNGGKLTITSTGTAGASDAVTINNFTGTGFTDATDLGFATASVTANGANAVPKSSLTFDVNGQTVTLAAGSSYTASQIATDINSQVGTSAKVDATLNGSGDLVLTSTNTAGASDAVTINSFSSGNASQLGFAAQASVTANGAAAAPANDLTFKVNNQTVTLAGGSSYTAAQVVSAINSQVGTSADVHATLNTSGDLVVTSTGTPSNTDTVTINNFAETGATPDASTLGLGAAGTTTVSGTGTNPAASPIDGLELTIAATGNGIATDITFGTGANQISTLNQLNTALAANNLQASIDSTGAITITTSNNAASSTIGAIGGSATGTNDAFANATVLGPVADPNSQATRASLVAQYNQVLEQINTTAQDSSFNGINLLNGDTLDLTFDETGASKLSISGVTFNDAGLGLSDLTAGTDFLDSNSANAVLTQLTQASTTLNTEASALGSNLSVVEIRQDFNKSLINVLQTGASNLTLADPNEEAANSQALSTRQSIAVSALALANQSQQSVLQLLR